VIDLKTDSASAGEAEPDPLAGTGYRTLRRIAAGGMGQLLEAEHGGLRRRVAVKLLKPALVSQPGFVDRLRLEAQALASIHHPNVVLVHDHAATPAGVPFIAMELLRGRTLEDLMLERGAIPLPEALHLMDQVLAGLAAVHAAGLTHRDLKPANLFLCNEHGRTIVKLLDLGIVKVSAPERAPSLAPLAVPTAAFHAIGTPRFMSPEQALGQPCDARSDIYAAGVLLYVMLSGKDPFHRHHTQLAILTAHAMEEPEPLAKAAAQSIPLAIERAVARALAKDAAARFGSVAELAAALGAATVGTERLGPARTPNGTEKMAPGAFRRWPLKTASLDGAVFPGSPAGSSAMTAVGGRATAEPADAPDQRMARGAPSFGLPPVQGADASLAGAEKPASGGLARLPAGQHRGWLGLVALLWALLAVVAWRVFASAG
jgi:serine/threonine protein kinase